MYSLFIYNYFLDFFSTAMKNLKLILSLLLLMFGAFSFVNAQSVPCSYDSDTDEYDCTP